MCNEYGVWLKKLTCGRMREGPDQSAHGFGARFLVPLRIGTAIASGCADLQTRSKKLQRLSSYRVLQSFAGRTRRRGCCSCCKWCARAARLAPLAWRAAAVRSHPGCTFGSHGSTRAGMCYSLMSCSACLAPARHAPHTWQVSPNSHGWLQMGCTGPERVV